MKCIDFDRAFADYLREWVEQNRDNYPSLEDMEEEVHEVYDCFLDTPVDFLDGQKPGEYFLPYDDAAFLLKWVQEYAQNKVDVPDMLLSRIVDLGVASEKPLMALVQNDEVSDDLRMLAINLLREINSDKPLSLYIRWHITKEVADELLDNSVDSLEQMGEVVVAPLLEALCETDDLGKEAMLGVLSRFPGDERIYETLMELFETRPERCAILSAYIGRLGDERALPALIARAADDRTGYLDYIELRCAIEELGGEAPEREFDNDTEYEELYFKQAGGATE